MTSWKLANIGSGARDARPHLVVGDRIVDVQSEIAARGTSLSAGSTLDLLESWAEAVPVLQAIADETPADRTAALAVSDLQAPLLYPGTIFCAAANYTDHYHEMTMLGGKPDKTVLRPYFFLKAPRQAVIGPGQTIYLPPTDMSVKIDWEVEIGVVIGTPAYHVSEADAMKHVAGYTILNDVSARDHMKREDWPFFSSDWFNQKNFDTAAPIGPWITPAHDVADPHDLAMKTWINDEIMQDSSSRYMVFNIPEQIASLSRQMTLMPGDIIATGTCSGVGGASGTFLKAGDRIRMEIEGLGTLENPVAAPRA